MSDKPQFASKPHVGFAQVTAANPNRDGTGALVKGFTAPVGGSRVDSINIKAVTATTAGMVRVYLKLPGDTPRFLTEAEIAAATPGAGVRSSEVVIDLAGGLCVPEAAELHFSTHNAETFNVFIFGGDFQ